MLYWCPWCGEVLKQVTPEDLECTCGFTSSKTREKKSSLGLPIYREYYRGLEKVYDWSPEVLTKKPDSDMFSIQT